MLPMFKTVGYCGNGKIEGPVLQEDNEWLNTSCLTALHMVVNLFSQYFSTLSFMLHDILDLLVTCILQGQYYAQNACMLMYDRKR